MAEATEKGKPAPKKDPIVDHSMAKGFLISCLVLAATVAWSIADETWIRRPYKSVQSRFRTLALKKAAAEEEAARAELEKEMDSDAYKEAKAKLDAAEKDYEAKAEERRRLEARLHELTGKLNDVRLEFQIARGDYQPFVYKYDQARNEGDEKEAAEAKKKIDEAEPKIKAIFDRLQKLSAERQEIQGKLQDMKAPADEARKALAAQVPAAGKQVEIATRKSGAEALEVEIVQVYNPALRVVDRCQSCHIATDKPGYTPEDWDAAKAALSAKDLEYAKHVFTTHPGFKTTDPKKWDALEAHPALRFGCTTCHFGNGPATNSPELAHGLEATRGPKKWARPISTKGAAVEPDEVEGPGGIAWEKPVEFQTSPMLGVRSARFGNMMEASCARCHLTEVDLRGAPQLSMGRQLVEDLGCWGCHKMAGFEVKEQELAALKDKIDKDLKPRQEKLGRDVERLKAEGEEALEERAELSRVTHEIEVAERRIRDLDMEVKFIGPDLNRKSSGLREKIYPEWLPRWIYDPQHFRPGTWMPNPLLDEEQVVAVAAYIWQQASGEPGPQPPAPSPEEVAKGKRLFQSKGCVACHLYENVPDAPPALPDDMRGEIPSRFEIYNVAEWWKDPSAGIPEPTRETLLKKGPHFGPALDRIGEKVRSDWLVKWILDPKALQPHTRMPKLRVTEKEASAIASFLASLKKEKPGGERFADFDAKRLEDRNLAAKGLRIVLRQGCYNCHAIDLKNPLTGELIANPGKIGAELSSHGSKPLAQFDFGFLHDDVPPYRPAWLQTKLLEPRVWDTGKYKGDPNDRLRMPRFGLSVPEAQAIVTVLSGYIDEKVPGDYIYRPDARKAAIIEGERLVRKFNCRSCHVIDGEGQWAREDLLASLSEALKISKDDAELERYLPPLLNGQGHRTRPEWLFQFLKDPGKMNPFSTPESAVLRPWHVLHMPTFDMSDSEAQALVDYFGALEKEPQPYPPEPGPVPPEKLARGRQLFVENKCASCHQIGEYQPSGKKPVEMGPNFALARARLREDWLWRFIPDPQAFIPGTVMPAPGPFHAKPYALQPEAEKKDIQALASYLLELGKAEFRAKEGWVKGGSGPQ
jgi:mono/diheme cytochrome c family protein